MHISPVLYFLSLYLYISLLFIYISLSVQKYFPPKTLSTLLVKRMDFYTQFPLAKRTRSNINRFLVDQHLERRKMKRAKNSGNGDGGAGVSVECLDSDSDGDLVRVGREKGESLKSRKCGKGGGDFVNKGSEGRSRKGRDLGKKLKKDCGVSEDEVEIVYDSFESFDGGKVKIGGDDEVHECGVKKDVNVCEFDEEVRDLSKLKREEEISDVKVVLDNRGRNGGRFCDLRKKGKKEEGYLKLEVEVSDDWSDSDDESQSSEDDVGKKGNVWGSEEEGIVKEKMDVDEEYVSSGSDADEGRKVGEMVENRNVEKKNGVWNGNDDDVEVHSVSEDDYSESSSSEDVDNDNVSDNDYQIDDSSSSDHTEVLDDSSEYANSDEDEDYSVVMDEGKDEEKCRTRNKIGVERKGNEKIVKGGSRGSNSNGKEKKKKVQDRLRVEHPAVASLRSSTSSKSGLENLNARKSSHPRPVAEVFEITSDSDDDVEVVSDSDDNSSGGKCVPDDVKKRPDKTRGRKNLRHLKILADSLCEEGEGRRENVDMEQKSMYRLSFRDEDPKPEKSDFDKEIDDLFAELTMCLACEEIGSTPSEVDNNDFTDKMPADGATLCSQGSHLLVLDEQIGIVCKRCSYVHIEIKHILPSLSKSSERRGRSYFVHERCSTYADHFHETGAEHYDHEDNNYKTGTVWDLIPGTRLSMYEHQREGFEFIWTKLAGDIKIDKLEKPLSSRGGGCIISHAPGTGKTRLTVCFLHSFMKMYPDSKPVVIAPRTMLHTWEEECKKWNFDIPFHNMNKLEFSGQENAAAAAVCFLKKERGSLNITSSRLVKLLSWKKDKSILGISYQLFEKLVGDVKRNVNCGPIGEQMGRALIKLPTLLILDEGHTPRNDQSRIYKSLSQVETERRIILSGTPFQNNMGELYNTLRLVNRKFGRTSSGATKNQNHMTTSKESKSKWVSLTKFNDDSDQKLRELRVLIDPLVHVHEGTILDKKIPGLKDALILLRPTDLQQQLMKLVKSNDRKVKYFEVSGPISLVSVHPSLLPECWLKEHQFSAYRNVLKKEENNPYSGVKTKFVIELCRLSVALDERVLVFGQYVDPLIFLKKQLLTQFKWTEGKEVLYMDGSFHEKKRQLSISSLNDPSSKARVLLASTKACSEGINLVGASRVVLLDVVWNPSVERQAISRAYRLGQKKIVYTYHLMAGSMDVDRYRQQTEKDRWSELIFSSKDLDSREEKLSSIVSEDKILQAMLQHNDKLGHMFDDIVYQPKESDSLAKLMTAKNS